MKLVPKNDYVLIKKSEDAKQTTGGLYIPTTVDEMVVNGEILAVGPGKHTEGTTMIMPMTCKVGEVVVFDKRYAVEVKCNDEKLLLVKEECLMCQVIS